MSVLRSGEKIDTIFIGNDEVLQMIDENKHDKFGIIRYMNGATFSATQVEEIIKNAIIRWNCKEPLDLKKIIKWLSMDDLPG